MPSTRSYSQALQGHGHGHGQPLGQDSTLHQHSGSLPIRNRGREETLPRRDFDFVQARREDEELFEAFMEDMFEQEDEDPRQRFVIRFRDRATVITCEIDKRKDDESARWNPGEQEGSEQ
ncbi:UNVERIFIED_CONTAM: hypothetical protein K2H54_047481, partial [Gekko kuhli]